MPIARLVLHAASLAAIAVVRAGAQTPFERAKAELLLRDRLPCLGCHALGSEGGRLAPDLATVRQRRSAAYVVSMIDDPQRVVPGAMMPRIELAAGTRTLLLRYLTGTRDVPPPAVPNVPAAPAFAGADTSGARLYARFCAGCHGAGGRGDGPNARYLPVPPAVHASREAMARRTDDRLYDAIATGGATLGRSPRMPPFGGTLTPVQISALVRHIRALCGCEQPRWAVDGERR